MWGVLGMHALHVQRRVAVDLVQAKQTTRQAQQTSFHPAAMSIFDGAQHQNPNFHLLQQQQQAVLTTAPARCLEKQLMTQLLVLLTRFQNPPDSAAVMPRVLFKVLAVDEVCQKAEHSI